MVDRQRLARVLGRARQGIASLRRYAAGDRQALVDDEVRLQLDHVERFVACLGVLADNGPD